MQGIIGWGVHLPYRRLDRSTIKAVAGSGGGAGARTVASFDEDTTTMGAEAARAALLGSASVPDPQSPAAPSPAVPSATAQSPAVQSPPARSPRALWFATTEPAYADRTNANAIHAVLRLNRSVPAYDVTGSVRSALGAIRAAANTRGTALVVTSDTRTGLPGGADESNGGDAAAALILGEDGDETPVLAEIVAWESVTEEFLDRWRTPGDPVSKVWEERFGETRYTELGTEALKLALESAGIATGDVSHLVVAGLHERAARGVRHTSGFGDDPIATRITATVGNPGAAQPALLLAATLEQSEPGQYIVLLALADGADAIVLRTTDALRRYQPARPVEAQIQAGAPITYGRYLHWRGLLPVEPPRRPEPARVSSPAANRNADYKFGFPLSGTRGTIVTFTIDKLSYTLSPPLVFAIVDFDPASDGTASDGTAPDGTGARLPIELTDTDPDEIAIGGRVEMTFRRLATSDGIHNYFWKGKPVREAGPVRDAGQAREAGPAAGEGEA